MGTIGVEASTGGTEDSCATVEQYSLERQTNIHAAQILASCGRGETGGFALHEFLRPFGRLGATAPKAVRSLQGRHRRRRRRCPRTSHSPKPRTRRRARRPWSPTTTRRPLRAATRAAPSAGEWHQLDRSQLVAVLHRTWNRLRRPGRRVRRALTKWVAIFLASGCGGQGLGVWTSPDGVTWSTGACAHNGSSDDRESGRGRQRPVEPVRRTHLCELEQLRRRRRALQVAWSSDEHSCGARR